MAEAFFNNMIKNAAIASSAGTTPAPAINPVVAQAMLEVGIDIRKKKPKMLTMLMADNADLIISMGCGALQACPVKSIPAVDWQLDDPEGQPLEKVRAIRDEIRRRVEVLIKDIRSYNAKVRNAA